jgi:hypothetical protein
MPFNPDDYISQKSGNNSGSNFNPDDYISKKASKYNFGGQLFDKVKAFTEGAGQGLTLGNVGNIGGAMQALASYLGKPGQTNRQLEAQGFTINEPSAFDVGKAATNAELDKSYEENPWAYRAGFVGGSAPLAAPGRAVFDAAGKGIKGGMALGGIQGALSSIDTDNPTNQAYKAAGGAAFGGAIQGLGQLAGKSLDLAKKYSGKFARMSPAQADAYLKDVVGTEQMAEQLGNASENPQGMVDLQNRAVDAINRSRQMLKQQGLQKASQLSQELEGTSANINPNDYLGYSPEADQVLSKYARTIPEVRGEPILGEDNVMRYVGGSPAKTVYPDSVEAGGNEVNALKRYLQGASRFKAGTVTDPNQQARMAEAAQKAADLRMRVEGLSPNAADLNKNMQESVLLQQALRQGAKNSPLAFVSTEAPDRMATLARSEARGAGGLFDLGNQLGAAKAIAGKNVGSGVDSSILKAAGRSGLRGVSLFQPAAEELSDFPYIQQLVQESVQSSSPDNSTPATPTRSPIFGK